MLKPSTASQRQSKVSLRCCAVLPAVFGICPNGCIAGDDGPPRPSWGIERADDLVGNSPDSTRPADPDSGDPGSEDSGLDSLGGPASGTLKSEDVEPAASDTVIGVAIEPGPDGAYRAKGRINGRDVIFVVDSNANWIAIPDRLKSSLKLNRGTYLGIAGPDGRIGGYQTRIARLELGPLSFDNVMGWLNSRAADDVILLGVGALTGLRSERRNGKLTLIPSRTSASDRRSGTGPDAGAEFKRSLDECQASGRIIDRKTLDCLQGR